MNRREFLHHAATAGALIPIAGSALGATPADERRPGTNALSPEASDAVAEAPRYQSGSALARIGVHQHRFGVNYTPSKDWWYCWNDFSADDIARDLDAIASLSVDHIRIMVLWTFFQPDPAWVSPAHLQRLDTLLRLAAERRLDVCASMLVGHLTAQNFRQGWEKGSFFSAPAMLEAQRLYFTKVAEVCRRPPNFLGFDLGNELDCCWKTADLTEGDRWSGQLLDFAEELAPDAAHVNGVDHGPWFHPASFSAPHLARRQKIVALHAWIKFTGALDRGGPLGRASVRLASAMAALARAYAGDAAKPVWIQEYGASEEWMSPADVVTFCDRATRDAIGSGVNWFTWWASHDIDRKFDVNPLEYSLGLFTVENRLKPQGESFRAIAREFGGKPVTMPAAHAAALPLPPTEYTDAATWSWLERWMAV